MTECTKVFAKEHSKGTFCKRMKVTENKNDVTSKYV